MVCSTKIEKDEDEDLRRTTRNSKERRRSPANTDCRVSYDFSPDGVEDQGRLTRVAAFPIGIDSERFIRALEVPDVIQHMKELKERFAGRKVMLGVDRLDMIKWIPQKILAFEKFLEENASWREKVVLLQIAVPTRTDVSEYQKLTSQVHEIVGRINGRFGTLTQVPIHHLDRSLDFYALCALYAVTDVALVTSLRDGMNLVSYEFVACQEAEKGVLILSEVITLILRCFASYVCVSIIKCCTVTRCWSHSCESLEVWNITEVAASIGQALNMSPEEREKRHRHNFHHVKTHTAQEWAETFVSELNDTVIEAQLRISKVPPELPQDDAIRRDPSTTIAVLSGSSRSVLDKNFGEYDMWLAAENGMFLRLTNGEWMTTVPEHLNMEWVVSHVFKYFSERTPRSHFETRDTSLIWNYKYADIEFGRLRARDLLQHLWTGPISNASVDVVQGSRSVEDEDVYTFFEPELPSAIIPAIARSRPSSDSGTSRSSSGGGGGDRRPPSKSTHNNKSSSKSSSYNSNNHNHHNNKVSSQRSLPTTATERKSSGSSSNNHSLGNSRRPSPERSLVTCLTSKERTTSPVQLVVLAPALDISLAHLTMSSASSRHYLLQPIISEHKTLKSLVLTDSDGQGVLCMNKDQLEELRVKPLSATSASKRTLVPALKMRLWPSESKKDVSGVIGYLLLSRSLMRQLLRCWSRDGRTV
ncbi:hypothetical protein Bca52824_002434 [Brassica carinata]|uniref:Alpha,alpha-trehalose-phosphate synthase (UDP-forming) n=1 Tax=Brassica carinata TaxID=52824 RepID=A0A8X8BAJ4_BRACI|nr:hypothetical protein Bca52824_002434 [Brassica carinata]